MAWIYIYYLVLVLPNCYLEVEDILQDWSWRHKFNLIHMRLLFGAFMHEEWERVYRKYYECVSELRYQLRGPC